LNILREYKCFFLLLCVIMLLASCVPSVEITENDNRETSGVSDSEGQSYVIIRSDTAGEAEIEAAVRLRGALSDMYGYEFEIGTDWVKKGEIFPPGRREILVGSIRTEIKTKI
jgi:hypothetical protein